MKLSESQIRQVIREELEAVLSEMHGQEDSEKPENSDYMAGRPDPFEYLKDPKAIAAMVAVSGGVNAALSWMHSNHVAQPIMQAVKAYLQSKGMMESKR